MGGETKEGGWGGEERRKEEGGRLPARLSFLSNHCLVCFPRSHVRMASRGTTAARLWPSATSSPFALVPGTAEPEALVKHLDHTLRAARHSGDGDSALALLERKRDLVPRAQYEVIPQEGVCKAQLGIPAVEAEVRMAASHLKALLAAQ